MKRTIHLAVVAAGLSLAVPAAAQDSTAWNGWYVGLSLGTAAGLMHTPVNAALSTSNANYTVASRFKQNSWGIIGGAQAGYNYLLPNGMLIGAEIDGSGTSLSNSLSGTTPILNTSDTARYSIRRNIDFLNTARLRLGMVLANGMLVYGTGGLAYGGSGTTFDGANTASGNNSLGITVNDYRVAVGWTLGAGIELPYSEHLRLRTEYLYADLGSRTIVSGAFNLPAVTGTEDIRSSAKAHILRVGINYALN